VISIGDTEASVIGGWPWRGEVAFRGGVSVAGAALVGAGLLSASARRALRDK